MHLRSTIRRTCVWRKHTILPRGLVRGFQKSAKWTAVCSRPLSGERRGLFLYLCWMSSVPVNAKRLEEPEKIPAPPLAAPTTKKQTVKKNKTKIIIPYEERHIVEMEDKPALRSEINLQCCWKAPGSPFQLLLCRANAFDSLISL